MKMNPAWFILAGIRDNKARSVIIFTASLILSALLVAVLLVMLGTRQTIIRVKERMGADVMVVGQGNQRIVEDALLSGHPTNVWLERGVLEEIRRLPGVAAASPQLFLSTMRGASCCSVSDMFMIAYEPETDFTVTPWLKKELGRGLALGEAIGGRYILVPEGQERILIYGYEIDLAGTLETSGSGLDQSMFFTWDTALEIARKSAMQAERELIVKPDSISAILVKAASGVEPADLAERIAARVPQVQATPRELIFSGQARAARRIEGSLLTLLAVVWLIGMVCIAAGTALSLAQRRQSIGVLRSLGGTGSRVRGLLLAEGAALSAAGALLGSSLGLAFVLLFRTLITGRLGVPVYQFPLPWNLAIAAAAVLLAALAACLSSLLPIRHLLSQDPDSLLKDG